VSNRTSSRVSALFAVVLGTLSAPALAEKSAERSTRRPVPAPAVSEAEVFTQLADERRLESIDRLEKLLESGQFEGDQKAELMLRLAELYFEEFRRVRLMEEEAYIRAVDACEGRRFCGDD
jgi:hypothetical protein